MLILEGSSSVSRRKCLQIQITKGRKQLIQLITDMDVGMDVSNNQEAQLATIDQEMRVQLIEIVLLCLVKLKTVMSILFVSQLIFELHTNLRGRGNRLFQRSNVGH